MPKLVLVPGKAPLGSGPCLRTLDIYDTTVGTRIAPTVTVYASGIGKRITGILRNAITADLSVEILKAGVSLGTLTIPSATAIDTEVEIPISAAFADREPLVPNILASDGSQDAKGVASITVEWTPSSTDSIDWAGGWSA